MREDGLLAHKVTKLSTNKQELYGAHIPCVALQLHAARELLILCR